MKHTVTRKTTAAQKELEQESTRMAACLCSAIDAVKQAETYAGRKDSALRFSSDNISSIGLSLYIRRREEAKPSKPIFQKLVRDTEARIDARESRYSAHDVTDGARSPETPHTDH